MNQLEEIKARAEKATEGPWRVWDDKPAYRSAYVETTWAVDGENAEAITDWLKPADADFIAHARTDVPKLVAALEAVEGMAGKLLDSSDSPPGQDDFNKGIDQGFAIAAKAIRSAITEALK